MSIVINPRVHYSTEGEEREPYPPKVDGRENFAMQAEREAQAKYEASLLAIKLEMMKKGAKFKSLNNPPHRLRDG